MDIERLEAQLAFLMEADKLKNLYRQTYTRVNDLPPMPEGSNVTEPYPRRENDAEHSFSLALFTAMLAEYSNEPIDVLKTMKMVLIHDVVEIDAGDTYCYDEAGKATKAQREQLAADRLFGLLPEGQREEYLALWEEFEAGSTPEARFAAAVDRVQPAMLNSASGGISWKEHDVTLSKALERNGKAALGSEVLWEYEKEHFIMANVDKGLLKNDLEDKD